MRTTGETFDFNEEIQRTEGFFPKLFRGMLERYNRLSEFIKRAITLSIIIGIVGVIIALISLYKQFTTTDAGKIIRQIYEENKQSTSILFDMAKAISLPDELECTPMVLKIRHFQNDIVSFSGFLHNLLEDSSLLVDRSDSLLNSKSSDSVFWEETLSLAKSYEIQNASLGALAKWSTKRSYILQDSLTRSFANWHDTLAVHKIVGIHTFTHSIQEKQKYLSLMNELKSDLRDASKKAALTTSYAKRRILISDFIKEYIKKHYTDDRFENLFHSLHYENRVYMEASNQCLLLLKNRWIEEELDRIQSCHTSKQE